MKETLEIFGKRLKSLRKAKSMNQEELADKLGIHNSYVGLLERGERIPSLLTLTRIAKYFELKPVDLIMEEKKQIRLSPKQKELLKIINEGAQTEINTLYNIAKIIVEESKKR